jgi:hypothetical protein
MLLAPAGATVPYYSWMPVAGAAAENLCQRRQGGARLCRPWRGAAGYCAQLVNPESLHSSGTGVRPSDEGKGGQHVRWAHAVDGDTQVQEALHFKQVGDAHLVTGSGVGSGVGSRIRRIEACILLILIL